MVRDAPAQLRMKESYAHIAGAAVAVVWVTGMRETRPTFRLAADRLFRYVCDRRCGSARVGLEARRVHDTHDEPKKRCWEPPVGARAKYEPVGGEIRKILVSEWFSGSASVGARRSGCTSSRRGSSQVTSRVRCGTGAGQPDDLVLLCGRRIGELRQSEAFRLGPPVPKVED